MPTLFLNWNWLRISLFGSRRVTFRMCRRRKKAFTSGESTTVFLHYIKACLLTGRNEGQSNNWGRETTGILLWEQVALRKLHLCNKFMFHGTLRALSWHTIWESATANYLCEPNSGWWAYFCQYTVNLCDMLSVVSAELVAVELLNRNNGLFIFTWLTCHRHMIKSMPWGGENLF